jgi:hypothetical protein
MSLSGTSTSSSPCGRPDVGSLVGTGFVIEDTPKDAEAGFGDNPYWRVTAEQPRPALAESQTDGRPADRLNPGASRAPDQSRPGGDAPTP